MAPMATGIIIREMESPNVRKYPSGVKDMTTRIAVIRPILGQLANRHLAFGIALCR